MMGGNGYLALYLAGIVLGNASYAYRNPFIQFQDAMAWVMQIGMFLTLGLLVNPHELKEVFWVSLGASVFLMFLPVLWQSLSVWQKAIIQEAIKYSSVGRD